MNDTIVLGSEHRTFRTRACVCVCVRVCGCECFHQVFLVWVAYYVKHRSYGQVTNRTMDSLGNMVDCWRW